MFHFGLVPLSFPMVGVSLVSFIRYGFFNSFRILNINEFIHLETDASSFHIAQSMRMARYYNENHLHV